MNKCDLCTQVMEYNEPLNLSVKKKPIAVVTPSSTNKCDAGSEAGSESSDIIHTDDTNERIDGTSSPEDPHDTDTINIRTAPLANSNERAACNNNTNDTILPVTYQTVETDCIAHQSPPNI